MGNGLDKSPVGTMNADSIYLGDFANDSICGAADSIYGSDFDNDISGARNENALLIGRGADSISASADSIFGGDFGNDLGEASNPIESRLHDKSI